MVMGVGCPVFPLFRGKTQNNLSKSNPGLGPGMDPGIPFCQGRRAESWPWPAKMLT